MDLGRTALAVHDLISVAVAAAGLLMVAAAVGELIPAARRAALIGTGFVVSGGLSKAIGKLIGAMSDRPPPQLLDDALFPLLAPGMLLLAVAVMAARRGGGWAQRIVRAPLSVPIVIWAGAGALAVVGGSTPATVVLIGIATIGNVALGVALILWSTKLGLRSAAWLYAVNLAVVLSLPGMARALEQATPIEWIEQNVNLAGQLAFLLASRLLLRAVSARDSTAPPLGRSLR